MSGFTLDGSNFKGGSGGINLDTAGTYPCTLKGASLYRNNKYQSDEEVNQITLIWDTGLIGENDDGEEMPVLIYDAWLTLSLNEKANLIKRLTALAGGTLDPETARVNIGGITDLNALQHWKDNRSDATGLTLNGEELFGKEALVTVTINDKGYPKVTTVAPPVNATASTGKFKRKTATAEAPAGAPT